MNFSKSEELLSLSGLPQKNKESLRKILVFNCALCFYQLLNFEKAADMLIEVAQKTGDSYQRAINLYQAKDFQETAEILLVQVGQETCE